MVATLLAMLTPRHDRAGRSRPAHANRLAALSALSALAITGMAMPAKADTRTSAAQGAAAATVARPLAVTGIEELDFGMVASSGAGAVVIPAGEDLATFAGSARSACKGGGDCPAPHPARFVVTGEQSRTYRIALPRELRVPGGSASQAIADLRVGDFVVRTASRPEAGARGRLDPAGRDTFLVGGTLHIPAALPPGRYAVPVPVVVTYE